MQTVNNHSLLFKPYNPTANADTPNVICMSCLDPPLRYIKVEPRICQRKSTCTFPADWLICEFVLHTQLISGQKPLRQTCSSVIGSFSYEEDSLHRGILIRALTKHTKNHLLCVWNLSLNRLHFSKQASRWRLIFRSCLIKAVSNS